MDTTTGKLKQIKDEVIECKKCALYKTRTLPVVGQGSHQAKAVFVGEAPGANEDRTGVPFCGSSGRILDELFQSIGRKREDAYICNILKCRPPNNRDPLPEEKTACVPYLMRQIEAIKPKVICPMGNHAAAFLLEEFGFSSEIAGISKIHGKIFEAKASFGPFKIIAFYHPAVVVYNANTKDVLKEDFQALKKFLK
ncbi:MAG: uracil-DNA glycosylase [Patescibacteria group bacterium]|nr:uracil-DNA glycosylase [Patescibacteria group bacterium]